MKRCRITTCGVILNAQSWSEKNRENSIYVCRACAILEGRKYRKDHAEECRASRKRWRINNKEEQNAVSNAWQKGHRDHMRSYHTGWREANRDKVETYLASRRVIRAAERAAAQEEKNMRKKKLADMKVFGAENVIVVNERSIKIVKPDGISASMSHPEYISLLHHEVARLAKAFDMFLSEVI